MAYFSNGCEGEDFYNECSQCLNNEPCPIGLVQAAYNYDACGNKLATKILNQLVTQKDGEYVGCQMKPILDNMRKALNDCRTVLEGYEQWEADIILDGNEKCLEDMKTEHYDKFMELQAARNKALKEKK